MHRTPAMTKHRRTQLYTCWSGIRRSGICWLGICVLIALVATACSSDAGDRTEHDAAAADVVRPTPSPDGASPTRTPPPTSTAAPEPTPTLAAASPVATSEAPLPTADGFAYAVARARADGSQIPVYDRPGGITRTLLDVNEVDGTRILNPLFADTFFGNPLVLRLIDINVDDDWFKVQVPTRPNHSHVWVRADDFEILTTDVWIEATVSSRSPTGAGELWVYRDGEMVYSAPVASGRDSRPTPFGTGWVGQMIDGPSLSPAYGPWIVDFGIFSEKLGTFGGGGSPLMVVHGTNQPELIGHRVTSGALRVNNADLEEFMSISGLMGAPVVVHNGRQIGPDGTPTWRTTQPAVTTNWSPDAPRLPLTPL